MIRGLGFGLVETLVALALGAVVAIAALSVYARSAADARTNGVLQQLHENARYAADLLEREIRGAAYVGPAPDAATVFGITPAGQPPPPGLAVPNCVASLALDLARPVVAADGAYALDARTPLGCPALPTGRVVAGADTLTLRRALGEPSAPERGRLQLVATRTQGVLIADGTPPSAFARAPIHDLEVATYYVAADSLGAPGVPALRRKRLIGGPAGPRFDDEELVPGVEDLQVEFGVDGPDADEVPERYVDPDDADAADVPRIVRVRLRVRADLRDPQWRGLAADASEPRVIRTDAVPRVVVTRTVHVRSLRRR